MSSLSEKITPLHSSLLEDEPELIDLITKYINNFPGMVNELKVAFENRNWVDFEIYLHDLKSTGGNYGFMVITETVVKIKTHLDNRNNKAIVLLMQELENIQLRMLLAISGKES